MVLTSVVHCLASVGDVVVRVAEVNNIYLKLQRRPKLDVLPRPHKYRSIEVLRDQICKTLYKNIHKFGVL